MDSVSLEGKTTIVTGANTGIGKETAREFAKRGARVILACRNRERAEEARRDIAADTGNHNIVIKTVDLGSLQSIREFAEDINEAETQINILVNNAGVYMLERRETADGFEMMFGVNHLGHFYLTYLLLDKLKSSAPSRIVNLTSLAHAFSKLNFKDLQSKKRPFSTFKSYAKSKTANILFSVHLASILKDTGVTVYAVHPGLVRTDLAREYGKWGKRRFDCCMKCLCQDFLTAEEGAMTSLYCALEPNLETESGKYYAECKEKRAKPYARDPQIAQRLWDVSRDMCGL